MIFANPMAVPAMLVKPRTPAMSAMTRKVMAQDNMVMSSFGLKVVVMFRLLNRATPCARMCRCAKVRYFTRP